MSKSILKSLQITIIAIWLCLIAVLVYRQYISGEEFSPLQSLSGTQFQTGDEWLGIYGEQGKIGFAHISSEKIGDQYRFIQHSETEGMREGKTSTSSTRFSCLTDSDFRVRSYEFEIRTGDTQYKASGEVDENNMLLVFFDTAGKKETRTRQLKERPYLALTIKKLLFAQGLELGKRFTLPVLNLFTLDIEDTVVDVQGLIPVKVGINVHTAYTVRTGESTSWLSDNGITLKEHLPSGLLYIAETEAMAKAKGEVVIFDFLSVPVLKAGRQLSDPEALTSLKIRIQGIDVQQYPLLNEGRQALSTDILLISRETVESMEEHTYDLPYQGKGKESYLSPTHYVESDHHTIQYNAEKFIDIEKHAFSLARYLTSNLYITIRKTPWLRLLTSMEIFQAKAGESNEHTVMFTSFARAGGLPARMVGGLVYLKGYFYYNTWPEVWLDRWVPVDPSMGQFPADVTHIRLVEGDMDTLAEGSRIMNDIQIEILEAL